MIPSALKSEEILKICVDFEFDEKKIDEYLMCYEIEEKYKGLEAYQWQETKTKEAKTQERKKKKLEAEREKRRLERQEEQRAMREQRKKEIEERKVLRQQEKEARKAEREQRKLEKQQAREAAGGDEDTKGETPGDV